MTTTTTQKNSFQAKNRPTSPVTARLLAGLFFATTITVGTIAWSESRQITDLQGKLDKREAVRMAVATSAPRRSAETAGSGGSTAASDEPQSAQAAFAQLMNNPQVSQYMDARIGQAVDTAYADLFTQLNLNQSDSDSLRALLVQRAGSFRDVMNNAANQGLDPTTDRAQMQDLMATAQGQVDNSIRSLLGDTNYQTFQTYNANVQQNFRGGGGFGGGFGAGAGN